MTVLNRKLVRKEIADGMSASLTGSGKPFSSIYSYQKGKLGGESPVCYVISGKIDRDQDGIGTQRYYNFIEIELHVLIYDGDKNNPLTEAQREDKRDECEAELAGWCATHQKGTYYNALEYTPEPSEPSYVKIDGNPYMLEIIKVMVEAKDL